MQAVQLQAISPQLQNAPGLVKAPASSESGFLDTLKARMQDEKEVEEKALPADRREKRPLAAEEKAADKKTDEKNTVSQRTEEPSEEKSEDDLASAGQLPLAQQPLTEELLQAASRTEKSDGLSAPTAHHEDGPLDEKALAWLSSVEEALSGEKLSVTKGENVASEKLPASSQLEKKEAPKTGEGSPALNLLQAQELSLQAPEEFLARQEKTDAALQEYLSDGAVNPALLEETLEAALPREELSGQGAAGEKSARSGGAKEKKADVLLTVHDLRTAAGSESGLVDSSVQRLADRKEFNAAYQRDAQQDLQLTMELSQSIQQNITASDSQSAAATGSTFQAMLNNAVQSQAPEFVRAGSVILKDNNQGQINLILHPESLGNVKIHLSLSDKVITGQITVHSAEAYEAFRESIDSIRQAFAQSGFDTGSFDLNFAGNSSFAQNENGSRQEQADSFRANATYGDFTASQVSGSGSGEAVAAASSQYSVDIVA